MKYSIGIDYGTKSGRAVLVELGSGKIIAQAVKEYTHGVMDEYLQDGVTKLPPDFALEHPQDYLEVLAVTIPTILKQSNINKDDVIGVGIDFTACTMLPIDKNGKPLCFYKKYETNYHSYVKLWKHHGAQKQANKLNEIAKKRNEPFLSRYGGKISSEWMFPKIMEILEEDEALYNKTYRFIEAADWVVLQLTGNERRNSCTAGYKAIWHKQEGYPSKEFFSSLDSRLENVVEDKLSNDIYTLGTKAGEITKKAAKLTGLNEGVAVAVANVDAHVSVPSAGITKAGEMLMIMGTSTCHIILGDKEKIVPGMCGVVEDGVMPGFLGYEAGQSCVGDHFDWFVNNMIPAKYEEEAKKRDISIHQLLREKASKLKVGESGLLALDWWNGNRSILVDADLTGTIIGMTLQTKAEEIYRALIEATAFGTKIIIDTFKENGVDIHTLYAAGGIAKKDEFMMQIYADVIGMDIKIVKSDQAPALGSAMFGSVAAGKEKGGYGSIFEAANDMGDVMEKYYTPNKNNEEIYKKLYNEYKILHDYFGKGENDVMKRLKDIKKMQSGR